jgi:hypothetical protein
MFKLTQSAPIDPNKEAPPKTSQAIINKQLIDINITMLMRPKLKRKYKS